MNFVQWLHVFSIFQFQVLALLKGTKELGVAHFIVDAPMQHPLFIFLVFFNIVSNNFNPQCLVSVPPII
jgi:hypothetical protein